MTPGSPITLNIEAGTNSDATTMFVQRFALAGNARERKTIRLGIVISTNAASAHVCVISNCHTLPARMSWMTPGLKKPMISTYTYTNMTLAHSAASFSFTCILTSSSSLGAYLLACIVFSITLTSSNSVVALLLVFIVYSFVDVMGRSPHRQEGHAEVTDATDHAMKRSMINQ